MGAVKNIGYDKFPKQGELLNKDVQVCFRYDTSKVINSTVVRDDYEEPWLTIIRLNDGSGRYILSSECQYTY